MSDEPQNDVVTAWPLGGYAPGKYLCKCNVCTVRFEGEKRATQCLECAVKILKRNALTEPKLREIWDHATNATCQTLQDKGMCNCPDGGCIAASVEPEQTDVAYHCAVGVRP